MNISTEENLSSIQLYNIDPIYWSVHSSTRKEADGIKELGGGIVILASCEHHFIRVHKNMLQDPSNDEIFYF